MWTAGRGQRPGILGIPTRWRDLMAVCTVAIALVPALSVWAADPEKGTFSIVLENDAVGDADRHYTSGIQLSWTSGPEPVPIWARRAARLLPVFGEGSTVRVTGALGQNLYTPDDLSAENPPRDDRPYAGWLYGAIGLTADTGSRLDQLELTVGVVGPLALGKQTQKFFHDLSDSADPRGWDKQLSNEPGLVLTYQRSWRVLARSVSGFGFDLTPHLGGALGNVFTYANAGFALRLGYDLPQDYGPPRIQPSLPGSRFFVPHGPFGAYLFAGVEGRAVARNIFLDGNTFGDSRSVDRNPFVGDLQVGIALTWRRARVAYTHVFRTDEFEGQDRPDDFGAVSVSVRF
jgi:lipid A 3-O-deacylase